MSQQSIGNTVADIYRGVITDVINQVKEAFLDENIDIDVLSQLKKEWEDKVNSSGCVDLENRQMPVGPPAMRPHNSGGIGGPRMAIPVSRIQSGPQQMMPTHIQVQHHGHHMEGQPQGARQLQMQYVQQQVPLQSSQMGVAFPPGGVRMVQSMQQGQAGSGQQFVIPNQVQGMMFIQGANGQHIPVTMGPSGVQVLQHRGPPPQQGQVHQQMHQLDGNADRLLEESDLTGPSTTNLVSPGATNATKRTMKKPTREEAERVVSSLLSVLQLDGGGGGMSDSSSEDEEEDNDPLRRIADRIGGDGQIEDGDTVAEEDPLNSGDDQSDDEDLDTLFDAENVIMCQFEKVHRARSKWKFQLKDGIMHIDNRDYCFQRCTGEAEW